MHFLRHLPFKQQHRKGQAVIEFLIVFPVMFTMIAIFYSLFSHMLLWQTAQANLGFILRETSTDAYVQRYSANECAGVIRNAFPKGTHITISSRWDQIDNEELTFFNWLQPSYPCYVETVNLTVTYVDYLNIYLPQLSTITVSGKVWTSWQNRHFRDYKAIMDIIMAAMTPIYVLVDLAMSLLGALPHKIVQILRGG